VDVPAEGLDETPLFCSRQHGPLDVMTNVGSDTSVPTEAIPRARP
jgi:hypothetical protein